MEFLEDEDVWEYHNLQVGLTAVLSGSKGTLAVSHGGRFSQDFMQGKGFNWAGAAAPKKAGAKKKAGKKKKVSAFPLHGSLLCGLGDWGDAPARCATSHNSPARLSMRRKSNQPRVAMCPQEASLRDARALMATILKA